MTRSDSMHPVNQGFRGLVRALIPRNKRGELARRAGMHSAGLSRKGGFNLATAVKIAVVLDFDLNLLKQYVKTRQWHGAIEVDEDV